jgi:hypothetical protein
MKYEKIVFFRYNEETYNIKVYEDDWAWGDDCVPCDPSALLMRVAEEHAVEAGMRTTNEN